MFNRRRFDFAFSKRDSIVRDDLIVTSYIVHQNLNFLISNFIDHVEENFQQKFMRRFVVNCIEILRIIVQTNKLNVMYHHMKLENVELNFVFVVIIFDCVLRFILDEYDLQAVDSIQCLFHIT